MRPLCRSLAGALAEVMMKVRPPRRAEWARAMVAELEFIDSDFEALRWSVGCLCATLRAHWRESAVLHHRWVRWGIALWTGWQAASNLLTTLEVLAYQHSSSRWAALVHNWWPAEDYRLLAPVFDSVNSCEIGFGLMAVALYLLAAVQLLRRRLSGASALAFALAVCLGLWVYELSKPVYFYSFPLRDHLQDAFVYAFSILLAWIVWVGSCGAARSRT